MVESIVNISNIENDDYNELVNKYIDVIEERDSLLLKKQIYLDAKHINMSYDLMKEEINLKIKTKKLKIEKNIILSSFKLQKSINKIAMELIIERETNLLLEQIKGIDDLLVESKKYISSYEKDNDYKKELSNLYKKMIVRISPIFNNMNKNKEKLWEKTELAYIYNDLNKLTMISSLTNENNKCKIKYNADDLYLNIQSLKKEIENMKCIFPFNIENEINKVEYKKKYRNEFKERIQELEIEELKLIEEVTYLKSQK